MFRFKLRHLLILQLLVSLAFGLVREVHYRYREQSEIWISGKRVVVFDSYRLLAIELRHGWPAKYIQAENNEHEGNITYRLMLVGEYVVWKRANGEEFKDTFIKYGLFVEKGQWNWYDYKATPRTFNLPE